MKCHSQNINLRVICIVLLHPSFLKLQVPRFFKVSDWFGEGGRAICAYKKNILLHIDLFLTLKIIMTFIIFKHEDMILGFSGASESES